MSLHEKSVAELASGLRAGEFSAIELTRHCLERIKAAQDELNCMITLAEESALAEAAAADQRLAAGDAPPLTGIPVLHKDIFCTEGLRTTCGSLMLDNFVAPYDATVVARLREAGTVMLGKTNMDEFAMGSSNETSYYGPVRNPWDTERVPGGSSGGSAAAVAASLAPLATGTDTGGSIRQPAALTGVTGFKPTYGRVSRYGMIAFASSLDQAGGFTRSAEDAAYLLQAMAGFDPLDSTSAEQEVPDYVGALDQPLEGLRLGRPAEYFAEGLSDEVRRAVDVAIDKLVELGASVVDITLPSSVLSVPTYYVVAPAEASSNLARFDGVRYGYRCKDPVDLLDLYERSRGEGFGREVQRRVMIGTYVLSHGYYDAYYLKAQKVRQLIADDFARAFEQVDLIVGPTTQSTAFRLGEKTADPIAMYLNDIYTIAANLAGLPGVSVPCGIEGGLPVGLQLLAPAFGEARMLAAAHQFQQHTDWHTRRPEAAS